LLRLEDDVDFPDFLCLSSLVFLGDFLVGGGVVVVGEVPGDDAGDEDGDDDDGGVIGVDFIAIGF